MDGVDDLYDDLLEFDEDLLPLETPKSEDAPPKPTKTPQEAAAEKLDISVSPVSTPQAGKSDALPAGLDARRDGSARGRMEPTSSGMMSGGQKVQELPAAPFEIPTAKPLNSENGAIQVVNPAPPPSDVRYFILKSNNLPNLRRSVENAVWATQPHNERKLNEAYHTSDEVRLIFSVNQSGHFQGFARMSSPIGQGPKHGLWVGSAWGGLFQVEWEVLYNLPFHKVEHLANPMNEGKPVKIAKDGQEVPPEIGNEIVRIMTEGARANRIPKPDPQRRIHVNPSPYFGPTKEMLKKQGGNVRGGSMGQGGGGGGRYSWGNGSLPEGFNGRAGQSPGEGGGRASSSREYMGDDRGKLGGSSMEGSEQRQNSGPEGGVNFGKSLNEDGSGEGEEGGGGRQESGSEGEAEEKLVDAMSDRNKSPVESNPVLVGGGGGVVSKEDSTDEGVGKNTGMSRKRGRTATPTGERGLSPSRKALKKRRHLFELTYEEYLEEYYKFQDTVRDMVADGTFWRLMGGQNEGGGVNANNAEGGGRGEGPEKVGNSRGWMENNMASTGSVNKPMSESEYVDYCKNFSGFHGFRFDEAKVREYYHRMRVQYEQMRGGQNHANRHRAF